MGYHVLKAHDAQDALTIIGSGIHVDLLFTDVMMPGRLRSTELATKAKIRLPDLAVLFTSGYTQNAIVHGGRLDPGVELLPKPYTREALARKIRHVLANQKHLKQLKIELAKHQAHPLQPKPPPAEPALRILLVEDAAGIRASTTELLTTLGHTVIAVASAEAALATLETTAEKNAFDVLIVDVGLPDMPGTALAQDVKKKYSDIHVIYATGQNIPDRVENAVILKKPYDAKSLAMALNSLPITKVV